MSYPARDNFQSYQAQYPRPTAQEHPQSTTSYRPRVRTPTPSEDSLHTRPPGSPSQEQDSRPLLPSISNLLGFADSRQASTHDHTPEGHRVLKSPYNHAGYPYPQEPPQAVHASPRTQANYKRRWDGSDVTGHAHADHPRVMDPPSRQSEVSYESTQQPGRPYMGSPSAASDGSYYSPTSTMSVQPGMHPGQIAAGYPSASQSTPNLPTTNPWEHHHHYIGQPSQQGMYPPLPDRYICPTCNKAFSRPSSLKIHSHSHTGEKPFKCPHAGCGKAFSVKSNMKRHEKGCHRAPGQAQAGAAMDMP